MLSSLVSRTLNNVKSNLRLSIFSDLITYWFGPRHPAGSDNIDCLKSFYSRESGFNEDGGGEVIVNYVITHGEIKPSDGPIFVVDII